MTVDIDTLLHTVAAARRGEGEATPVRFIRDPKRRANTYAGACRRCGGQVAAKDGYVDRIDGRWLTEHIVCPAAAADDDGDDDCDGHETLAGAHMGETVYCDGSCRRPAARVAPARVEPAGEPVTDAGFYRVDGTIYRVQISRDSGRAYAKVLILPTDGATKGSFVYAPGAMRLIRAEHALTAEQARAFGHEYGVCCRCVAVLDDPISVHVGLGRTCAMRMGVHYPSAREWADMQAGALTLV